MAKTIAELTVESLKNAALKRVYGLTGDSLNGFTDALRMPPHISFPQAKGFSLWAAKSILSGRGHEIIDLAKTNVLQRILS